MIFLPICIIDTETYAFSWWLLGSLLNLQFNLLLKKTPKLKAKKNHESNQNIWVTIPVTQNTERIWHYIDCSEIMMNLSMPMLEIPELLSGIIPGHWHLIYSPQAHQCLWPVGCPYIASSCSMHSHQQQPPAPHSQVSPHLLPPASHEDANTENHYFLGFFIPGNLLIIYFYILSVFWSTAVEMTQCWF